MVPGQSRILLVDDLPVNLDVLATFLSHYKIQVAKDGDKALSIINGDIKPDLILMDVEMPGMNGYQVCEKIRSDKRYDSIPIIFLTAKTDTESIVRGFQAGGQDYVKKPFDLNELLARVNTHLELKRSKEDLAEMNTMLERRVEDRTRDLTSALSRLEVTNKELDTFVYRASHDLKGPTATLLGLVYIAKETQAVKLEEVIGKVEQTVLNMNKVLDKLILKHIISSVMIDYKIINLKRLVNETKRSLGGTGSDYDVIFEEEQHPSFYSDFSLLKTIFINLFENSLTFHSASRVVIKIGATKTNDAVLLSVEDNGDGIRKDIEEYVFDLFYRGSIKSKGNGLGLYLVKKAVEKLEGKVSLATMEGRFTRIIIELPIVNPVFE